MVAFLISVIFSVQSLSGQEKTASEKEKELKLQQAIELQKKALADQKKAQDIQAKEIEKVVKDAEKTISISSDAVNNYSRSVGRSYVRGNSAGFEEPFIVPSVEGFSNYFRHSGDSERTTWDFSKQVKETTLSREYSFDVEASASSVVMTIIGDCKSGQIRVKIIMPGGKTYSDIVIDEFGNLNWRKSFSISEEENKDKAGEWKFKIDAEKATGYFKISLQTY